MSKKSFLLVYFVIGLVSVLVSVKFLIGPEESALNDSIIFYIWFSGFVFVLGFVGCCYLMIRENIETKKGGIILKVGKKTVRIVVGDMAQQKNVPAIMTFVDSKGFPLSGEVDNSIRIAAGEFYHDGLTPKGFLKDKDTHFKIVRGNHKDHQGCFNDIIFMVVNGSYTFDELFSEAFFITHTFAYPTVALQIGTIEKTPRELAAIIMRAFLSFAKDFPGTNLQEIRIVVPNSELQNSLFEKMQEVLLKESATSC